MNRRDFLQNVAVASGTALLLGPRPIVAEDQAAVLPREVLRPASSEKPVDQPAPRELTVAGLQTIESRDVAANERAIHRAIDQAAGVKADFLLTPEGGLSGYYPGFDRSVVAEATRRVAEHAKNARVGLLLGTCYKEIEGNIPDSVARQRGVAVKPQEFCYDQVRVYAPNGEYLGAHAKILLCSSFHHPGSGEMKDYVAGTLRTFSWAGICFGVLICNDLWATPGYTTMPNPYLAWGLRTMGAQVIFHAVGTAGSPVFYRSYHESNQALWAMALNLPIVTTNASDGVTPSACRAGVILPDGERKILTEETGEQFFSYKLAIV